MTKIRNSPFRNNPEPPFDVFAQEMPPNERLSESGLNVKLRGKALDH
jgi:hypothetical protein